MIYLISFCMTLPAAPIPVGKTKIMKVFLFNEQQMNMLESGNSRILVKK